MNKTKVMIIAVVVSIAFLFSGCINGNDLDVPYEGQWGIYSLDTNTWETTLLFSLDDQASNLSLNPSGDTLVFSMRINGNEDINEEICAVSISGNDFKIITNNEHWDLYPTWAYDGSKVAFLSGRNGNLDIYLIDKDGENEAILYDSGHHDADIHWSNGSIVFTSKSCIYMMDEDGANVMKVTSPDKAGEWGNANLPFGDYDPRLDPSGTKVIFERLEGDDSPHGNYNIYMIELDGSGERRLTDTYYSQGFASWSHSGEEIVFIVSAIGTDGKYDIYMMGKDGNDMRNITPDYYPDDFLCHTPIFSINDDRIFFIGEWWV